MNDSISMLRDLLRFPHKVSAVSFQVYFPALFFSLHTWEDLDLFLKNPQCRVMFDT